MITLKIGIESVNINARGMADKLENDRAFWTFAASEWAKLVQPYVPFESGDLRQTTIIEPKTITYDVPYAHYQYEGFVFEANNPISQNGVQVGFSSELNRKKHKTGRRLKYKTPKTSAKWDLAAAPTQLPNLASSMQAYIDSGRLKLDG